VLEKMMLEGIPEAMPGLRVVTVGTFTTLMRQGSHMWEGFHDGVNVELVECVPDVVVESRGVEVAQG